MKINIKKFLFTLIFISFFICFVNAEQYYNEVKGEFEVSEATINGDLNYIDSFDYFNDAVELMKTNNNYVIRHSNGWSPSKIVAVNTGTVYAWPSRNNNSDTLSIYQHPTSRTNVWKDTYISDEYEMIYLDTERVYENGKGMVHINMNGFDGYVDLEYVDIIPSIWLDNNVITYLGGGDYTDIISLKLKQSFYSVEQNGNYLDLTITYYYAEKNSEGYSKGSTLYLCPAFDFMEQGTKYYSKDGVDFYFDKEMKNYAGTGYNYYQYLPLRSKTTLTADVLNNYIKDYSDSVLLNKGDVFIDAQNKYGVNALLLYSIAIHESGYGTSYLAKNKFNLFGWNAIDSSPISSASTFSSVDQCIYEQASLNLRGYLDIEDWRFFGSHLGDKGSGFNVQYASDPYWGQKISSLAYRIDKSSKNFNGELSDYKQYTLALIKNFNVDVYNERNELLFKTAYGTNYQRLFIVVLLDENGKIQSTNGVKNGYILPHKINGELQDPYFYDFDESVGYISTSDLTLLYEKKLSLIEKDGLISISSFNIENNNLIISGTSAIKEIEFNNLANLKQQIILEDYNGEEKFYDANILNTSYNINDGHDYNNVGFYVSIPCSEITGSYIIKIKTTYNNYFAISNLRSSNKKYSNQIYKIDGSYYRLFSNQLYNYRFEINKFNYDDDLVINKPSARTSLFSFDKLTLSDSKLNISGQSLIYYLDYSEKQNYKIIVVNDSGEIYNLKTENFKCPIDYSSILNIENNLDYICFNAEGEVPSGEYSIFSLIEKEGYQDLIELTNRAGRKFDNDNIYTDSIRNRIRVKNYE